MKKVLAWAIVPLALAAVLLALNLREIDVYEFGTLAAPAAANLAPEDQIFLTDSKVVHVCRTCGECAHKIEILQNRRVMSVRDRDGWYKLFWAADEEYYYEDASFLAGALAANRTAGPARGTWRIHARAGPALHGPSPSHECTGLMGEVMLDYELVTTDDPLPEAPLAAGGPLRIPERIPWLTHASGLNLGWRLTGAPHLESHRCACSRP